MVAECFALLLDLVFVVPYCASFFVVLVRLRLVALSGDTSSAVIHRRAWTARWHADPRTGRSATRQLADQLRLAFTCGVPPSHYYVFEPFDDALRSKAVDAIGDAVNTAARIEELTKVRGTSILVSDGVHAVVENRRHSAPQ